MDCIFRLRNDDNREMALAFEAWTAEERERARAGVARRRESWRRETELERHFSDTAAVVAEAREQQEMAVMAAVGMAVDAPGREERLRADRRLWTRLDECYKRLEVSAKYGVVAAERMFDTRTDVDGITQEEEKKLAKILKQLEEETKDRTGKKRKGPEGEVEKDNRGTAGGATAYGGYMQQGSGGGGPFVGAGMYTGGPWRWNSFVVRSRGPLFFRHHFQVFVGRYSWGGIHARSTHLDSARLRSSSQFV